MQKPEHKTLELEIAEQNQEIIYSNNKTLAKFEFLRLWEKNPRVINEKNLSKLEKQILELGVYKPLLITVGNNYATILGGNMRYKAISNLRKKYPGKFDHIWVSIVNPETDEDRFKYAISDNFSAGEYSREELAKHISIDQVSLFDNYNIEFTDKKSIKEFIDELAYTENELKFKAIKKNLKDIGINDETIEVLEQMTAFNKCNEDLEDVDIKGEITGQKFPLLFWIDDEYSFNELKTVFATKYKDKYDTEKLVHMVETTLKIKIPTKEEEMTKLKIAIEKYIETFNVYEELEEPTTKIEKELSEVVFKAQEILRNANPT